MRPDDSDVIQPETISSKIEKKLNFEYQTLEIPSYERGMARVLGYDRRN